MVILHIRLCFCYLKNLELETVKYFGKKIALVIVKKNQKKREGEIQKANNCVNKFIAGRSKEEYYEDNKETILEKNSIYYTENKDKIIEQRKKHREENAEELKLKSKNNYENIDEDTL